MVAPGLWEEVQGFCVTVESPSEQSQTSARHWGSPDPPPSWLWLFLSNNGAFALGKENAILTRHFPWVFWSLFSIFPCWELSEQAPLH